MELYNLFGQLVIRKELPGMVNEHNIDVSQLSAGTYIVELRTNSEVLYSGKVVKGN